MRNERAAEHGELGVGVPLQGVQGEGQPQRVAALEVGALGGRQLDPGEIAVALDERPERRVGERIPFGRCRGGRRGRLGPRFAPGLGLWLGLRLATACQAVSTWISTSTRGRCSTCATRVIARPVLLMPVSRTSSPYWG